MQVTALGRRVSLTVKQVLAALLEQAADVEWDEQLGPERVAVQVTGQSKGPLQNRHQQKATGGGLAVPTLDLVGSTEAQFPVMHNFFFPVPSSTQNLSFPDQGSNPSPPAVEVLSLNHWTCQGNPTYVNIVLRNNVILKNLPPKMRQNQLKKKKRPTYLYRRYIGDRKFSEHYLLKKKSDRASTCTECLHGTSEVSGQQMEVPENGGRVGESVTFCSTPGILNWGNAPLPGDTSKIWRHFWLTQEGVPLWAETRDAVGLYIL